jgi:hypothetical protein
VTFDCREGNENMNYFKVNIYPEGKVIKEQVTEEEARGYLGAGIYYCGTVGTDKHYDFFIDREDKIQRIYDKYIKNKIKEYNNEIKRMQKSVDLFVKAQVTI